MNDEQEEAIKKSSCEIQAILCQREKTPRDAREGVVSGTGYILQGAIGAAGIAVLTPGVAYQDGAQKAGVLGGISEGALGIFKGSVRAANVAVGGIIAGSRQMVYGVAATPASVTEPRKGKWWNESESSWVETNLVQEEKELEGIPEDDADILEPFQKKFLQQFETKRGLNGRKVKDGLLYEVLEVPYDADTATIKRKYYIMARKYAPDRAGNKGNEEAANKLRLLGQAYMILKNEKVRKHYDRVGYDAFLNHNNIPREEEEESDDGDENWLATVDPFLMYAFLFGSDKFYNYFGRLAAATSASVGDSTEVTLKDARLIQKRRVTRLAVKLAARLDPWTAGEKDVARDEWVLEAKKLTQASYGTELVHVVGRVYSLAAVEFLGSLNSGIGLPSVSKWASCQWALLKKHNQNIRLSLRSREMSISKQLIKEQVSDEMEHAVTKRERVETRKSLKTKMIVPVLQVLWTTTVVDITSTLYETCQMVLHDRSVDDETRKCRGEGLKVLGEILVQAPRPKEENIDMAAQKDYEELAFMAVLETIVRKEEMARKQAHRAGTQ